MSSLAIHSLAKLPFLHLLQASNGGSIVANIRMLIMGPPSALRHNKAHRMGYFVLGFVRREFNPVGNWNMY